MGRLGESVIPGYGFLSRSTLRRTYIAENLAAAQIHKELNPSMYMIDRNQLGFQNGRFLRERLTGFQRGERIVRSIASRTVVRKANADVSESRTRIADKMRSGSMPLREENDRYGKERA